MGEAIRATVAYPGIDVGKRSHSACGLDKDGEVVFRSDLENRPADIDRLLERAGAGALVVVDQKRNIGALVLARAFAHGNPCAYLPGYAEKRAGASVAGARALWEAMLASARSGRRLPAGEDVAVRMLAREIAALDADVAELEGLVADSLAGDEVYECPLTVPGIGPKTAAALVTSVDISMFRGHDELASYCGVAPADSGSGTSVRSTSPQRGGNKQLKNLLKFQLQLPHRHAEQIRKALRRVQGEGDEAQQGAEGRGEKEAQGHLRGHARRGPVRGLGRGRTT